MERYILSSERTQTTLFYAEKLSFIIEGEMKIFHGKLKPKEFINTKPALPKILKESYTYKKWIN
jgi:hypothetical protein